jgi:hypothetical protein
MVIIQADFDTFGTAAAEVARRQVEYATRNDQHSAIPGAILDDLIVPVTEPIGKASSTIRPSRYHPHMEHFVFC